MTIAHEVKIVRNGDLIVVRLTDNDSYATKYRKSWSMKRYVDDALAHSGIAAGWDMTYSFAVMS